MAKNNAATEEMVTIRLFKDKDRHKEPLFVQVNGKAYLIERGVNVEVPKVVAEIIQQSEEQDNKTANLIAGMEEKAEELNNQ